MRMLALLTGAMVLASAPMGRGCATSGGASPQQDQGQAAGAPVLKPGRWQPPAGALDVPLWSESMKLAQPEATGPESVKVGGDIAGRPVTSIWNVSRPSMTIFPARGKNSGAALLVFPGGGYQMLAIDLEGTEFCDWATAKGITCAVLKYRVPQTWWHTGEGTCGCEYPPAPFLPLQDAQRAMSLLRERAASLGVDPHRIGVAGTSAGGHLVAAISNAPDRTYSPVDAADRQPSRPDFAIALYPGHLWAKKGAELYAWDPIRADAPPTFLLQAQNDPVDDVRHSISYFLGLREAKVPAEMHIYAEGGHAFGMRETDKPITRWTALLETWLGTIGMLPKP